LSLPRTPWYVRWVSRVLMLDADKVLDVFDVVEIADGVALVRTAYLFEVGEQLRVRVDNGAGAVRDVTARVRAHRGSPTEKITELELGEGGS
jgi:hypothetical protein